MKRPLFPDEPEARHLPVAPARRVNFEGEVVNIATFDSPFGNGTGFAISIRAEDGARCVHFTHSHVPEVGRRYLIRATVKEHRTNDLTGAPETVLTRAVYTPVTQPKLF